MATRNQSEAYDLSLFEPRELQRPQQRDNIINLPQDRLEKNSRPTLHPLRMLSTLILGAAVVAVMGCMIYSQAELNELTTELNEKTKILTEKMCIRDRLDQFAQVKKMGPLKNVLSKLPGMEKQLKDVEIDDRMMDRMAAIILSMTPQERSKPDIINPSRKRRIAAGSGMQVEDVNRLLKQFEQMQKMMKQLKGGRGKKRRFMPPMMP